jgi:sugar/nucleoside kinase (ribokinase family)
LTVNEVERLREKIASSRIAYFSGYSFASQLTSDATMYAANACRGKCEIWFNPGAPNTIQHFFKPYISDLVDVLLVNLDEAKVLTGKLGILEAALDLRELVGLAVITSGEDGCVVVTREDCIRVPVSQIVEAKDTTGAGDAFAAGFAVGRLRGLSLRECGRCGNAAAASFLKERSEALAWRTCSRYS